MALVVPAISATPLRRGSFASAAVMSRVVTRIMSAGSRPRSQLTRSLGILAASLIP